MSSSPSELSDADLRAAILLLNPSFSVPPIIPQTRPILIEKLRKMEKESKSGNVAPKAKRKLLDMQDVSSTSSSTRPLPVLPSSAPATYVFFDLEATGLAGSQPKARITELSMVSMSSEQLARLKSDLSRLPFKSNPELVYPRILNKLTLCFYPATPVPPNVIQLTGLDNHNLEDQKPFDAGAAHLLGAFLDRLSAPVCLVAHNGERYDFSLLQAELKCCGQRLADDLLCVDSLKFMRKVYEEEKSVVKSEIEASEEACSLGGFDVDFEDTWMMDVDNEDDDDDDDNDDLPVGHREVYENTQCPSVTATPVKTGAGGRYQLPNTPPPSSPAFSPPRGVLSPPPGVVHGFQNGCAAAALNLSPESKAGSSSESSVTPDRPIPRPLEPPPRVSRPRRPQRQYQPSPRAGEENKAKKRLDFNQPPSFSLPRLHEHIFGVAPFAGHGAEQDCLALMRVCAAKKLTVSADTAVRFNSIGAMW